MGRPLTTVGGSCCRFSSGRVAVVRAYRNHARSAESSRQVLHQKMGRGPNRSPVILAASAEASMDEEEAWLLQLLKDGEDPGEDPDTPRLGSPAVTTQASSRLTATVGPGQQRVARRPRARTSNEPLQVAMVVAATKTRSPEKASVLATEPRESLEEWLHANEASGYMAGLCNAFGTVEDLVAFVESASDLHTNFALPRQQAEALWNAIECERTQRDESQGRPFSGLDDQIVPEPEPEIEPEPELEPQQTPERSQPFPHRASPERPRRLGGVSSLQEQGHRGTTHPRNASLLFPELSAAVALRKRQRERRMRAEQRRVAVGAEVHKHVLARATKAMQAAEQTMQASLAAIAHDGTMPPS